MSGAYISSFGISAKVYGRSTHPVCLVGLSQSAQASYGEDQGTQSLLVAHANLQLSGDRIAPVTFCISCLLHLNGNHVGDLCVQSLSLAVRTS